MLHFVFICSNQKAVFVGGGGTSQHHEYLLKTLCDIIIICFPHKTIFILLDCFMQLLQIQRLAKYYQCFFSNWVEVDGGGDGGQDVLVRL